MDVSRSCLHCVYVLTIIAFQMIAMSSGSNNTSSALNGNEWRSHFTSSTTLVMRPSKITSSFKTQTISTTQSTASPTTSSMTSPTTQTMTSSTTQTMTSSTTQTMTSPTTPSMTSPTTQSMTSPTTQSMTSPTTQSTTSPTTPSMTSPTTPSVTSSMKPITSSKSVVSTTAELQPVYLQLSFSGSATNWTKSIVEICLVCKSNKSSKFHKRFDCYNVTKMAATTNRSSSNDYAWHINRVDSTSCTHAIFYWQRKWLRNGEPSSNWTRETDENQQPINHTAALIHCDGQAVEINTVWGVENVTDMACGPAFHNFTTASPGDFTGKTNHLPTATGIFPRIPSSTSRTTTSGATSSPLSGEGATAAIVVCTLAIIVVVFLLTLWAIRCVNKSARRRRLDLNYDDNDGTSISFDNVGRGVRFKAKSESRTKLYSSLPDDLDNEDDEQEVYSQTFTFTGEMEDVHHRSGGGVTSVYEDQRLSSFPFNNRNSSRRTSATHHPLTSD